MKGPKRLVLVAIGVLATVLVGCGSDPEPSGSVGSSSARSSANSDSATSFTTEQFLSGGLALSFSSGWSVVEDSPGEFSISSPSDPDFRLIVWKDIYPTVSKHGLDRVSGFTSSARALVSSLRANDNLTVRASGAATIGESLPATVVDVSVAPTADNDDPQCPERACVNFLGWPSWGEPYGLAGDSVTRFYLADATLGSESHLVVVAIEATSKVALEEQLEEAQAIVASIELP